MSGGHVARVFEEAGIPTVAIVAAPFAFRATGMHIPRTLVTPHLMARPLGPPGDAARHLEVLRAALALLAEARENPTVREFPGAYRPGGKG